MLTFTVLEERSCEETQLTLRVEIVHSDLFHGGVGGMLEPRRSNSFEVNCPREKVCRGEGRDCMWACGVHKSQRDPLGLRLPREIHQ